MEKSVIVAARRTPVGRYLGGLSKIPAVELGAKAARACLDELGIKDSGVDEVFVGCVVQGGLGQNPARQVALKAGLGDYITAETFNKVCGSGLEAVIQADRAIRCGDVQVAVAGGIENMSMAPYYVYNVRDGLKFGDAKFVDGMQYDGLTCAFEKVAMGVHAEHTAEKHGISRQMQDEFAVDSHRKASAADKAGLFTKEIVPIDAGKKIGVISKDETIRHDASIESVAKLPTVFKKEGTVTAANASALSDGAAMVVVAAESTAKKKGWKILGEIVATATAGVAPKELFDAPIYAVRQVVEKAGLKLEQIDLFELNEAFASQSLADIKALEIPMEKVNVNGGAIALGHPIGSSGARVFVSMIHAMEQRQAKYGVACLCLGGGNAVAMCIKRA
ncbi:MAG: Acetyl-CoA acetyltransferase [Phycisphaerae bacterium]|nr:Acetyl-CoA acetyltransferase [Phycisphaerae bacterium]